MAAQPESKFPTIRDMRDQLSDLIDMGYGDLPVQLVVAPDSTMQTIARDMSGNADKPALMIDFGSRDGRLPVSFISTERLSGSGGMPSRERQ